MKPFSDFGVSLDNPIDELTISIRECILEHVELYCIHCKSKRIVKDGSRKRQRIPTVQAFECKDCGGKFVERAFTPFYYKKYPEGLIFLSVWFFYERGSINWTSENITEKPDYRTIHHWVLFMTMLMIGTWPDLLKEEEGGVFQVDEMFLNAYGRRYYLIGINKKRKSVVIPILGNDALHLLLAFKRALKYTGKIDKMNTDGWKAYKQLCEWLKIQRDFVNKCKEGFVNDRGIHVNNIEKFWSLLRPWLDQSRGIKTFHSLDLFVIGYCFYHNFVKYEKKSCKILLAFLVKGYNKTLFILIYSSSFSEEEPINSRNFLSIR